MAEQSEGSDGTIGETQLGPAPRGCAHEPLNGQIEKGEDLVARRRTGLASPAQPEVEVAEAFEGTQACVVFVLDPLEVVLDPVRSDGKDSFLELKFGDLSGTGLSLQDPLAQAASLIGWF